MTCKSIAEICGYTLVDDHELGRIIMNRDAQDLFGKFFVEKIKDETIDVFDMATSGKLRSPQWRGLMKQLNNLSPDMKQLIRDLIITSISYGMHDFLAALSYWHDSEEGSIRVLVDGVDIVAENPDLQYEFVGDGGWEERFSKFEPSFKVQERHGGTFGSSGDSILF